MTMAHFAKVEDGLVTDVLVVPDEHEHEGETYLNGLGLDGMWVQTSYNTFGGVHSEGKTPVRYNYACIGFTYDPVRDAFIPSMPDDGVWVLDEATCQWMAA
jgi:hypothetical protein